MFLLHCRVKEKEHNSNEHDGFLNDELQQYHFGKKIVRKK